MTEDTHKFIATVAAYIFLDLMMTYQVWSSDKENLDIEQTSFYEYWSDIHGFKKKPKQLLQASHEQDL